ncbi:MAG: kinase, partial [Chlamydiae bacterium]|nr:kinase [Chlamydiota bacterium]
PQIVASLKKDWDLSDLKALSPLSYSYVLEGMRGQVPIVVKLSPDIALIEKEAQALEAFKGFGAVSLLGCEKGALLLEKAVPGECLKNRKPQESRIEIACGVIQRLHQAPLPKEPFPSIEAWMATLDSSWSLPQELLQRARLLKMQLMKSACAHKVLLHGDLHQDNILSHGNDWVVIDPKGVIGHPLHELWACVEDSLQDLQFVACYFNYPLQEVLGWYYVHLILAACWQLEDGLDSNLFLTRAKDILPRIEFYF